MNESTLTQLKVLVERAVRPVRASVCHKVKMREELLAHVTAVFEEETARLGDEQATLERAAQRFGNPAELTGQLQESVPTSDLIQRLMEFLAFRTNESTLSRAVRFAVMTFAFCVIFLLPVFIVQGRMNELPFLLAMPTTVFFFVALSGAMRQAVEGRFWRRAAVVAAASTLIIPGATFGVLLAYSGDVHSCLADVLPLLLVALLTPVLFVIPVYGFAVEFRSHREWMSLQVRQTGHAE